MKGKTKIELARKFFDEVFDGMECDDFIYEILDPDFKFEDELTGILNNDTIEEVIALGFKQKYGVDWHVDDSTTAE